MAYYDECSILSRRIDKFRASVLIFEGTANDHPERCSDVLAQDAESLYREILIFRNKYMTREFVAGTQDFINEYWPIFGIHSRRLDGWPAMASFVSKLSSLQALVDQLLDNPNSQFDRSREEMDSSTIKGRHMQSLHPDIVEKCLKLYDDGSFAEAVEKSFKVVRDRLRQLTTYERGADAFGRGKLRVRGAAAPHLDEDFNEAVKFLTMAIDSFRNEKSHTSDAKIEDPLRAYEYLRLSSLALHVLDDAEVASDSPGWRTTNS